MRSIAGALAALVFVVLPAPALSDKRVALAIGNSSYGSVARLSNPVNDATAVGAAFKRLGFDAVTVRYDLGADAMRRELLAFEKHASGADIAVVYYAGHGMEVDGQNYLIPVDAQLDRATAVGGETISLSMVAGMMAIAVAPNGRTIASGSFDGTVKVWDVVSENPIRTHAGTAHSVTSAAVRPDGGAIAIGSGDKAGRIWDTASGRILRTLEGHADRVTAVAAGSDGRTVVSGSDDRTVRLWDTASGRLLRTPGSHIYSVTALAVTQDGGRILSRDWRGEIKRWDPIGGSKLPSLPGDAALLDGAMTAAAGQVAFAGSTLTLRTGAGMLRAFMTPLPEGHWVSIAADGLAYIGSPGVEDYLLLARDFETRNVSDDFRRRYFKPDGLALGL
ncbi:MAG: caspase family protein [Hyphomicrobiaceae bacterium]